MPFLEQDDLLEPGFTIYFNTFMQFLLPHLAFLSATSIATFALNCHVLKSVRTLVKKFMDRLKGKRFDTSYFIKNEM